MNYVHMDNNEVIYDFTALWNKFLFYDVIIVLVYNQSDDEL